MSETGTEEGALCRRDGCCGRIELSKPENCSCHISPPCWDCENLHLECADCGWDSRDDEATNIGAP